MLRAERSLPDWPGSRGARGHSSCQDQEKGPTRWGHRTPKLTSSTLAGSTKWQCRCPSPSHTTLALQANGFGNSGATPDDSHRFSSPGPLVPAAENPGLQAGAARLVHRQGGPVQNAAPHPAVSHRSASSTRTGTTPCPRSGRSRDVPLSLCHWNRRNGLRELPCKREQTGCPRGLEQSFPREAEGKGEGQGNWGHPDRGQGSKAAPPKKWPVHWQWAEGQSPAWPTVPGPLTRHRLLERLGFPSGDRYVCALRSPPPKGCGTGAMARAWVPGTPGAERPLGARGHGGGTCWQGPLLSLTNGALIPVPSHMGDKGPFLPIRRLPWGAKLALACASGSCGGAAIWQPQRSSS